MTRPVNQQAESKHAPGEWTYTHNSWDVSSVYDANGRLVATVEVDTDVTEETQEKYEAEKDARARLIAAAPELLEIAICVLSGLRSGHVKAKPIIANDPEAETLPIRSLEEIIAPVIAKARGQS